MLQPTSFLLSLFLMILSGVFPTEIKQRSLKKTDSSEAHSDLPKFRIAVHLHPNEEYFPMSPDTFIKKSRLMKNNLFSQDKAYNKKKKTWMSLNKRDTNFYNPPIQVLANYKVIGRKNRRPRDKYSSNDNVYLHTEHNLIGEKKPTGIVPSITYLLKDGRKQYWLFYGYNYAKVWGLNFSHQGDWESVTLDVNEGQIRGAWLSAHGNDKYYSDKDLDINTVGKTQTLNIYSAKGSHALYNKPGQFHILNSDKTAKEGSVWIITDLEVDLKKQMWRNYAGAWGTVGSIATTTGPLGPIFKILK